MNDKCRSLFDRGRDKKNAMTNKGTISVGSLPFSRNKAARWGPHRSTCGCGITCASDQDV